MTRPSASLSLDFLGVNFVNPFLLASAPPTATGEMIGRAFEAGWGGAVTKTLVLDAGRIKNVTPRISSLALPGKTRKIVAFENIELVTDRPFAVWLKEIEVLRQSHPDRVVIASIMHDPDDRVGWTAMARQCENAGAQIIEINMSCPHGMPEMGMGAAIGQNPDLAAQVSRWTAEAVHIPVMAKMTPNVTDVAYVAQRCISAGAQAVAAINTVASLIGVDIETFEPQPGVGGYSTYGGLSGPAVKPIALRAVSAIARTVKAPISASGGIGSWEDAVEFFLLGASTVQICSEVMQRGYGIVGEMTDGLSTYLARKGFATLRELIGLALPKLTSHEALDRTRPVVSSIRGELCVKCGRCEVACRDAGYQAIRNREADGFPEILAERCTGCGLCRQICPVRDCIVMVRGE